MSQQIQINSERPYTRKERFVYFVSRHLVFLIIAVPAIIYLGNLPWRKLPTEL